MIFLLVCSSSEFLIKCRRGQFSVVDIEVLEADSTEALRLLSGYRGRHIWYSDAHVVRGGLHRYKKPSSTSVKIEWTNVNRSLLSQAQFISR